MAYSIPDNERNRIAELHKAGYGNRAIARMTGLRRDTITFYVTGVRPVRRKSEWGAKAKPIPLLVAPGFCGCGCGCKTTVLEYDDPKTGRKAGEHRTWLRGHYHKRAREMLGPNYACQLDRMKQADEVRRDMVQAFYSDRTMTRCDVLDKFKDRGFDRANLSRIFINGLVDHSRGLNLQALGVPSKRPKPKRPTLEPYERKEIPYENETDISYITKWRGVLCLDSVLGDGGTTYHDLIRDGESPAELLMIKEEFDERERLQKERRRFAEWEANKRPLQSFAELLPT